MTDWVFKNFESHFSEMADRVVEYYNSGYMEITVRLNDGSVVLYDDLWDSITYLPPDSNNLSEEEFRLDFGRRLRKVMMLKRMTQTELTHMTGIPQYLISNYLNGKTMPSFYNIDKLAKALGCSTDELRYI